MGLLDVPPASDADMPPGRRSPIPVGLILAPLALLIIGAISLAVGVSNVVHAGQIARNGIRVKAVVISDLGTSIKVQYTTASGQPEQGTLPAPSLASHRIGSALTVVYDPSNPSIVTTPGETSSDLANPYDPWGMVVEGILSLLAAPAIVIAARVTARRSRSPGARP